MAASASPPSLAATSGGWSGAGGSICGQLYEFPITVLPCRCVRGSCTSFLVKQSIFLSKVIAWAGYLLTESQQPAPRSLCAGLPAVTTFPGRCRNADLIEKTFKEKFWRAALLEFGSCTWLLAAAGSVCASAGPKDQHGQRGHP